ncbi:MAG: hypothetical protein WDZ39_01845 [Candidatus Spechtbacterales bacterium]
MGARITKKALERLKFPKKFTEKVTLLVRYHLFYYNVGEVTESSVRRLISKVGPENIDDLVKIRICDRMGSGVPKPKPYRLRHFEYMVEKVQKDPISVNMLDVSGKDVMDELRMEPGPKIGQILNILLDEVLDDPSKNKREYLLSRVKELGEKPEKELKEFTEKAMRSQKEFEKTVDQELKRKYYL